MDVGRVPGSARQRRDGGGAGALIVFAVGFVLMVIAPLAGQIIKLSVSRNREYLADAQGAMLTRYPPGLISALRKIADGADRDALGEQRHRAPVAQPALAARGEKTTAMERLFSTHPPIEERIRRLEEM